MSTLNCSSIYNIMPYLQYKKLQCAEKNISNCDKSKFWHLFKHKNVINWDDFRVKLLKLFFNWQVKDVEDQIRARKSEVEQLIKEMREANMESLAISPPEESKQFLDGKDWSLLKQLYNNERKYSLFKVVL